MNHKYKPADELLKKRQGVLFQKRKRKRRIIFSTVLIGILLLISFMKLESDRERQERNGTQVSSEDPYYYKVVVEDDDITVYKQDELYLKGSYQKQSNKYMILDENGTAYQDYYFKYTGETMMLYVRENDIYMMVYILNKEK